MSLRADQEYVTQWVPQGARVLDLGCNDGELLAWLRDHKGCSVLGVDREDAAVLATMRRGVDVIQQDLESGLSLFEDNAFDVVPELWLLAAPLADHAGPHAGQQNAAVRVV
jgi:methionine biosynthesis protein MetW